MDNQHAAISLWKKKWDLLGCINCSRGNWTYIRPTNYILITQINYTVYIRFLFKNRVEMEMAQSKEVSNWILNTRSAKVITKGQRIWEELNKGKKNSNRTHNHTAKKVKIMTFFKKRRRRIGGMISKRIEIKGGSNLYLCFVQSLKLKWDFTIL